MSFLRTVRFWQVTSAVLAVALGVSVALLVTADARGAPDGQVRVGVALNEWDIVVPEHSLPANTPLRIDVTNEGDLPHDLVIDDIAATEVLDPGESTTLEVANLTPGVYMIHCDVPGHVESGMMGELWVGDTKSRDHEH
jgi:uncharacterized cupredoxin-like copper-binding protein